MRSLHRASRVLAVVVVAATMNATYAVGAHPVDGAGTYRWVSPPAARKADNVPPEGRRVSISPGSPFQEFWTPDLQLTLFWPRGALGDGEVTLEASPIDPATLAPLPGGLAANGNAYRVRLDPVDRFAQPASVTLRIPTEGSTVFHSSDGRSWRQLRSGSSQPGRAVAQLETSGFVLAAMDHTERRSLVAPRSVGVAALGAAVAVVALGLVRSRRAYDGGGGALSRRRTAGGRRKRRPGQRRLPGA